MGRCLTDELLGIRSGGIALAAGDSIIRLIEGPVRQLDSGYYHGLVLTNTLNSVPEINRTPRTNNFDFWFSMEFPCWPCFFVFPLKRILCYIKKI